MLTVLDLAQENTQLKKKSTKEYCGPCPNPNCGCQKDGFNVKHNGYSWVFMCRGCWDSGEILTGRDRKRGWGNEINYLVHYRNVPLDTAIMQAMDDGILSFEDAYKKYSYEMRWPYERAKQHLLSLGADKDQQRVKKACEWNSGSLDYRSPIWQEQVNKAVEDYAACLWTPEGAQGLEYALSRGLRYKTIQLAKLGFSMQGGIPRLIIPSLNFYFHDHGSCWYFTVFRRDLRPDCPKDERWKNAKGSSTDELYMADCLKARRVTVLTEAPLDALSLIQECGDMVNVVATAGVKCGQNVANLARLALMPLVLVAFDADTHGDKEAKWWLDRLPNARRFRPFLHDINDMLVDNWDIRMWVDHEVNKQEEQEPTVEQALEIEDCALCGVCLDLDKETPAPYEHEELMYCAEHYPRRATVEPSQSYVQSLAKALPGWIVEMQPLGSTIQERAQQLEAESKQKWLQGYVR